MEFESCLFHWMGFPGVSDSKESTCNVQDQVQSLGWEDPLEKGTATHSSILAWKIPWTEEPGRLQSMGSQSQTSLSDFHVTGCMIQGELLNHSEFHVHYL